MTMNLPRRWCVHGQHERPSEEFRLLPGTKIPRWVCESCYERIMAEREQEEGAMIFRRQALQRDPPYDFRAALSEIRRLRGYGTADLVFILAIAKGTLWSIECRGSRPNVDDGDAIRKLLARCREEPLPPSGFKIVAYASPPRMLMA